MDAVITKKQKNTIMMLAGMAGVFGLGAGSLGLYLKIKLTTGAVWDKQWITEFTNGYFGVMSGFSLFLLGTVGYSLVFSRVALLVLFYVILLLSCDGLCVVDALLVLPYTKEYGKYAWETYSNSTTNSTGAECPIADQPYCGDQLAARLLICITTAVLIAFLLALVTTIVTLVALCTVRAIPPAERSSIALEPFSTPGHFQRTKNEVFQNDGFRK